MVKNPPANAGDTGSSPGPGRSHIKKNLKKKKKRFTEYLMCERSMVLGAGDISIK